jgi:two-component system phosphate regulon sensor histidine kinase PhoR
LNRFQRPQKWIQISLRSAVPAWLVLGLFVFAGSLSFRHALLGGVLAAVLAGLLAWRPARLRDALRRRIDAFASDTADPGRPVASDGLNRSFDRLVRVWRDQAARLAAQVSEQPRVIDVLPDPLLLIATDRRVSHANRAARELAGIDLKGYDLASGLRNPQLIAAVDAVLAGASGQSLEISFPVPVERHFAVRVEPLGEALPDAAVAVFHDLTALEQTERMRADFVANVSHELKTPLASLVGYIETLQGSAKDDAEARVRFLAIMEDQAQRMSRLVDDLLSLARIEMDEHSRPTDKVALGPLLQEVVSSLEPQAAKREIEITIDIAGDLPQPIADRDQLSEVFENLIGNAIRYGREGGEVRVTARPEPEGHITIAVEDEGEGIEAAHIPRLTERFYRVDPARSRERGGTGLGLAIVKHILSRHRGRLAIESEPGKGSRFSVVLPLGTGREGAFAREEPAAI